MTLNAKAFEQPKIIALGVSQKGQYIALEEYGYNSYENMYYTRFRLINVWKKQNVIPVMEWKKLADSYHDLSDIRQKLRKYVQEYLVRYKIVPRNQRKLAQK